MKTVFVQTLILDSELRSKKKDRTFFQTNQNVKQNGRPDGT